MKKTLLASAFTLVLPTLACASARAAAPACNDVPADVWTVAVTDADAGAVRVNKLKGERRIGKTGVVRTVGSRIIVPAAAGVTAPYLERVARCQLARGGAGAHDPLAVEGAQVTVQALRDGFQIDVRSEQLASAQEIEARASRLFSR